MLYTFSFENSIWYLYNMFLYDLIELNNLYENKLFKYLIEYLKLDTDLLKVKMQR